LHRPVETAPFFRRDGSEVGIAGADNVRVADQPGSTPLATAE
jgi:hypothetical protein